MVKDDEGNEYLAQTQNTTEYIQLWRQGEYGETWSSTQNTQKETALLFSNRCKLKDETFAKMCIASDSVIRSLVLPKHGTGFTSMIASVSWMKMAKRFNPYNRIGYDQVTTRLYTDTIRYVGGGKGETLLYG